ANAVGAVPPSPAHASPAPTPAAAPTNAGARDAFVAIPLPGANGSVDLDYLACERGAGRVWVPAGGTGSVGVVDARTLAVTRTGGFPTAAAKRGAHDVVLGPTAVALGDGVAYVGNRGDATICTVDTRALKRGECLALTTSRDDLAAAADGMAYVASA